MRMPIYKAELDVEGLADKIRANSSVAYCSKIVKADLSDKVIAKALERVPNKSKASMDDIDLYYTKSILVSTNWNKNDDVFDKGEVWAARNSPSHKRTNIEHDEKQIVGHITDVWPMDAEGNVLADDVAIDDLPDLYHLVNGAVIYRKWEDKDYQDTVAQLVEDIEKGEMYVSMEALFFNFAYALISEDGQFEVLERNKDSAFLTKHLRAYGGDGMYDNYKVGRLLRNIIFSGKGYVKKPANDNSVIILGEDEKTFAFSSAKYKSLLNIDNGVITVASQTKPNQTEMTSKAENIMDEQEKKGLTDKIASLEASVKDLNDKLVAEQAKANELAQAKTKVEGEKAELEKTVSSTAEAKAKVEAELNEIKTKAMKMGRVNVLVQKGYAQADAEAKVELFANLSDEQFEVLANELTKQEVTKVETEVEKDDKLAGEADKALEEVVATKEVVPVVTPVADVVLAKEELRKQIAAFLSGEETKQNS